MAKDGVFTVMDVGTTKVCTIVCSRQGNKIMVLGSAVVPSRGVRRAQVVNVDEAVEAVQASLEKAERTTGVHIHSVRVGVTGSHVTCINKQGMLVLGQIARTIQSKDVDRLLENVATIRVPGKKEVLHVLPSSFILDGQKGIRNPQGLHAAKLDVEAHVVIASTNLVEGLSDCLRRAGVKVDGLVLEPLADSSVILTAEERQQGVVLADIGGGTTDIVVCSKGAVVHTAVIPVAGYQFTNDLAFGLRTPYPAAEELKMKYGHALPQSVPAEETVEVPAFNSETKRIVPRREVCIILEARSRELLSMIQSEVRRCGVDNLPAGLVLTGGSSCLPGFVEMASDMLKMPVRIGSPSASLGIPQELCHPSYATAVGLMMWDERQDVAKRSLEWAVPIWAQWWQSLRARLGGLFHREQPGPGHVFGK